MDPVGVSYTIILSLLLILSAFFSATETAIFSINKLKVRTLLEEDTKNSQHLKELLDDSEDTLSVILIMNNLINISISSISTVIIYDLFGNIGVSIGTGVITFAILIFGEIIPKTFAINNAINISLKVAPIIKLLKKILKPILIIFNSITKVISRKPTCDTEQTEEIYTEEEIKTLMDASEESGMLDIKEKELLLNVFDFGDLLIKDVMIPRTHVTAINERDSMDEIMDVFRAEKYSRLPVYDREKDSIIGILNVKDLLLNNIDKSHFNLSEYMRDVHHTFEFKKVKELFSEMKKNKTHMYAVLNEYGGFEGIVTMEDLIEIIVGDIDDEFDTIEDLDIYKESENIFIVNGSTKMTDIEEIINYAKDAEETDYESIGGYLISCFNRFPEEKEFLSIGKIKYTILEVDKKSIKRIKIEI